MKKNTRNTLWTLALLICTITFASSVTAEDYDEAPLTLMGQSANTNTSEIISLPVTLSSNGRDYLFTSTIPTDGLNQHYIVDRPAEGWSTHDVIINVFNGTVATVNFLFDGPRKIVPSNIINLKDAEVNVLPFEKVIYAFCHDFMAGQNNQLHLLYAGWNNSPNAE